MNNEKNVLLEACISKFKKSYYNDSSIPSSELFEFFSVFQITKKLDLDLNEIEDSIVDGGNDGGIDSFIILLNGRYIYSLSENDIDDEGNGDNSGNLFNISGNNKLELIIVQAKEQNSFKETSLDKLYSSFSLIFNFDTDEDTLRIRFNPKLVDKIITFRKLWRDIPGTGTTISIKIIYTSKGDKNSLNQVIKNKEKQIIDFIKSQWIEDVSLYFLGSKELYNLYNESIVRERDLIFKENPLPIALHGITDEENGIDMGYVGVVSLINYFNFITGEDGNINEFIFERNIRHFLGNVDVNKKIMNSLANDRDKDFWWLNNGITIIASHCDPRAKRLKLTNVQIVNGLQTSYSIYNYFKNNSLEEDNRTLLVKVIVSNNKKTIDQIISATNSQNRVDPALLRATDDIQREIEIFFESKGYYYDRRKNYYKNQNKPLKKIFSIQNVAQYIQAILNFDPASARSKPTSLIKSDTSYKKIFIDDKNLESFLNCCLLHKKTQVFLREVLLKSDKKELEEKINDKYLQSIKNFSLHISRILASVYLKKVYYSRDDVASIDIDSINNNMIIKAIKVLSKALERYGNEREENIINIAKSKKFVEMLNIVIEESI